MFCLWWQAIIKITETLVYFKSNLVWIILVFDIKTSFQLTCSDTEARTLAESIHRLNVNIPGSQQVVRKK